MTFLKKNLSALLIPALLVMVMVLMAPVKVRADGEFKRKDAGNSLNFDASNCPGTAIYKATKMIETATSSDESVFQVNIGLPYVTFTEDDRESDYWDLREDGECEIIPMGPGTATLTLKDEEGHTITETVTVDEGYFGAYLKSKTVYKGKNSVGMFHSIDGMPCFTNSKISYGDTIQQVYSRYGTKVTLKLKGKTYKGTSDTRHLCTFTKVKSLYKLGTKGTLILEFGPAKIKKTVIIASETFIYPERIKPNAKKGIFFVDNIHKGDVITVKVGGKTVKTIKVKKNYYWKKFTFKSKKKMKKKTKVQYIVKNKYKQTLKKKTYKVK